MKKGTKKIMMSDEDFDEDDEDYEDYNVPKQHIK